MRFRKIKTLFMKEFDDVVKSKYVISSLTLMPLLFVILLPLMMYVPMLLDPQGFTQEENISFLMNYQFTPNWNDLSEIQRYFVVMTEFMFAMFLLLPVLLPTIIAADSMSGEKERGTVEGLVATPTTDAELYLGKVSGALIPSTVIVWLFSIVFMFIVNTTSSYILGYWYLPTITFILTVFMLGPLLGLAAINMIIWLSSKTSTSRDTQQFAGLLVLPMFLVVINSVFFALVVSELILLIVILVFVVLNYFLTRFGIYLLDRERWLKHTS